MHLHIARTLVFGSAFAFALSLASSSDAQATRQPQAQATPAPSAGSVGPDYLLGIGDKLRVEVYREPQLSQSLEIRPDGKITLPLVGDVVAAGSTPRALGQTLSEKLKDYLTNPVVTVIVAEANPPTAYVMGEVNNPGAIPLRSPLTVVQALAMAGGFKEFANTKGIRILRRSASGVSTIPFNYKEAVEGGPPVMLQPGDTLVVP